MVRSGATLVCMDDETRVRDALAAELRAERHAARMTLEQVAKASGLGESTIWRFEHGTRDPDVGQLGRVARVWGVSPAVLLARAEQRAARQATGDDDADADPAGGRAHGDPSAAARTGARPSRGHGTTRRRGQSRGDTTP